MEKLLEYLRIFADPTRLKLLKLLSGEPICVCDLVEALDMSQPAVSNQLSRLRKTGLVHVHREANWKFYHLDREGLDKFLKTWNKFWAKNFMDISELENEMETLVKLSAERPGGNFNCCHPPENQQEVKNGN